MTNSGNGHHPDMPGNVPILGAKTTTQRVNVGAPVQSLVRHMADDGTFEADAEVVTVPLPNGQFGRKINAHPKREDYVDATQLIAEICGPILEAVGKLREEVRLLRNAIRKGEPPD